MVDVLDSSANVVIWAFFRWEWNIKKKHYCTMVAASVEDKYSEFKPFSNLWLCLCRAGRERRQKSKHFLSFRPNNVDSRCEVLSDDYMTMSVWICSWSVAMSSLHSILKTGRKGVFCDAGARLELLQVKGFDVGGDFSSFALEGARHLPLYRVYREWICI